MKKLFLGLCVLCMGIERTAWCSDFFESQCLWEHKTRLLIFDDGHSEIELMGHYYRIIIKEHVYDCPGCEKCVWTGNPSMLVD